jgi:hypothetical protein
VRERRDQSAQDYSDVLRRARWKADQAPGRVKKRWEITYKSCKDHTQEQSRKAPAPKEDVIDRRNA